MKILQVIPVLSIRFGGPVAVVRSVSRELAKRHDVTVYTTTALDRENDLKETPFEVENNGYRIVYFPRILKFTGFNISPAMTRAMKKSLRKYDIIHLHSWRHFQDIITHHYSMKYNVPYVLQPHGSLPRIGSKRWLKWIYDMSFGRSLLRHASKVLALNKVEADQCRYMGVPERKIAVIPNGIDPSEYAELPPKGAFKKKFNISEDKKIILYLGRIHKTKGIDLLIKAYAYLIKNMNFKDAVLVIAGPDDGYLNEAKALANSLRVYKSTIFIGFLNTEDKIRSLVDGDVFVTPSFYGFPITFLEACAVGTPIITTSLGDRLEWIDGKVGYVTQPTPKDLAEAVYRIISDEELRKKLSRNCINTVKSYFSLEKVVERLEKIYEKVVKSKVL